MTRKAIPKTIKDQVLKEFNHLCAICGATSPQLHHIDEDHANSVAENLIPLCPNCHLSDQHNPTRSIDQEILGFFRLHKDPTILSPQFKPLWSRIRFLFHYREMGSGYVEEAQSDLNRFVKVMQMGDYYGPAIKELTDLHWRKLMPRGGGEEIAPEIYEFLDEIVAEVVHLILESLHYQNDWKPVRS